MSYMHLPIPINPDYELELKRTHIKVALRLQVGYGEVKKFSYLSFCGA